MAFHTLFTKVKDKRGKLAELKKRSEKEKKERAKTGFEVELLLVDKEGKVSNDADKLLSHIEDKELKHEAIKECCHSYIEMGVYPQIYVRNVATKFLKDMLGVLDVAEKYDLSFYPLAMYPYNYHPKMRTGGWYGVKKKIFSEKWQFAGRVSGFHLHYSLPKGVFNFEDRLLNKNALRSEKQKTINAYNFATAIDPALTTFTQSSPLYNGKFLGKDSRLLLYRGGDQLKYDGMYSSYQLYGALQPYEVTYEELIELADKRYDRWQEITSKFGGDLEEVKKKNKLDFSWNPVKINKVGSIELRNMDMNLPSTLMAISILVKYALKEIQREKIEIVPDNLAIHEPFKHEGERIYVPPFWHVNTVLQHHASWKGFDDNALYKYCLEFFSLCLEFVNKKYYPAIKPVKDMLKDKKTRSDEILEMISKKGYDPKEEVPEEVLRDVVLYYSKGLRKDIEKTAKLMESLTEQDRVWL